MGKKVVIALLFVFVVLLIGCVDDPRFLTFDGEYQSRTHTACAMCGSNTVSHFHWINLSSDAEEKRQVAFTIECPDDVTAEVLYDGDVVEMIEIYPGESMQVEYRYSGYDYLKSGKHMIIITAIGFCTRK